MFVEKRDALYYSVPLGTQCGYDKNQSSHSVPDGTVIDNVHVFFYKHVVPNGTKKITNYELRITNEIQF
ncbi:MAG: hypothetical protein LBI60_01040 [Bacteroidales bacterium]|jgi:hypothetical protein|nr:hypothetical protein [Bacteroidales bacterium]